MLVLGRTAFAPARSTLLPAATTILVACGSHASLPEGADDASAPASHMDAAHGQADAAPSRDAGNVSAHDARDGTAASPDTGVPVADGATQRDSPAMVTPPAPAAAVGYTVNTLSSTFDEAEVDLAASQTSGFAWYRTGFDVPANPSPVPTFIPGGGITLEAGGVLSATVAAPGTDVHDWVGTAFGGGAYFEATLSFDPENTISAPAGSGWPAWWGEPIEHFAALPAQQWSGQVDGYVHYVETDFFEYDIWSWTPHYEYSGAIIDWYGVWQSQACPSFCNVQNSGAPAVWMTKEEGSYLWKLNTICGSAGGTTSDRYSALADDGPSTMKLASRVLLENTG